MDLRTAEKLANDIKKNISFKLPTPITIITVGSIRRKKSIIKDIDLLVVLPKRYLNKYDTILKSAIIKKNVVDIACGKRRRSFIINKNCQVDLFITTTKEKPFALFHHTGSNKYNIRVRAHAKAQGYLLNQYGIFNRKTKKRINCNIKTEKDIAKFLNITYRPPEQRIF